MSRSVCPIPSLAALATTFLLASASDLCAQLGETSRWDQVTIGNTNLAIDVIGWARARDSLQRRVDEAMWSNVRFPRSGVETYRLAATAIASGGSFYGGASLRRGGLVMRVDEVAGSATVAYTNSGAVTLQDQQVVVGLPVNLSLFVGHTAVVNLALLDFGGATGCVLRGRMESHPFPILRATLGVPAVGLAVRQDLQFGHQTFTGELGAYMGYLNTALLRYDVTSLRLFVQLVFAVGGVSTPVTLVNASAPARSFAPFLP